MCNANWRSAFLPILLTFAAFFAWPVANAATYRKMDFGYNACSVEFGDLQTNVSEADMVRIATNARAKGFTYHPSLRYGKLMIGEYPMDCRSRSSLSWPLYLLDTSAPSVVAPGPRPNLEIAMLELSPQAPAKGQTVSVKVGIVNRGDAPAGRFDVQWWADERPARPDCSWTVDGLRAKGRKLLTCSYRGYPSGYDRALSKALVDPGGVVTESNEGDNVRRMEVQVVGSGPVARPNLIVSELVLSPVTPTKDRPVRVKIQVKNRGTAPAGRFEVQWWPGENFPSPACTWTVDGLAARSETVRTCRYGGYPSWYRSITTKAVVDSRGAVSESNEGDNVKTMTIQVRR
jgi:hypothetical protein